MDEALDLLCSTGYRKPIENLTVFDKYSLKYSLLNYHLLFKVKAEMDHFVQGLETTGIITALRNSPHIFKDLFIGPEISSVTAGQLIIVLTIDLYMCCCRSF